LISPVAGGRSLRFLLAFLCHLGALSVLDCIARRLLRWNWHKCQYLIEMFDSLGLEPVQRTRPSGRTGFDILHSRTTPVQIRFAFRMGRNFTKRNILAAIEKRSGFCFYLLPLNRPENPFRN
jgi:hypothetical protein